MDVFQVAAWWGAIVATLVLGWDVYKWRKSRASVRVSASPNMQTLNSLESRLEDDKNIFVEVVNQGDRLITITHVVVKHYKNIWDRLRNKPSMQGLIPNPVGQQPIPYELEPGKRWTGLIDQRDIEAKSGNGGYFYCGVSHTASKKSVYVRVNLE